MKGHHSTKQQGDQQQNPEGSPKGSPKEAQRKLKGSLKEAQPKPTSGAAGFVFLCGDSLLVAARSPAVYGQLGVDMEDSLSLSLTLFLSLSLSLSFSPSSHANQRDSPLLSCAWQEQHVWGHDLTLAHMVLSPNEFRNPCCVFIQDHLYFPPKGTPL